MNSLVKGWALDVIERLRGGKSYGLVSSGTIRRVVIEEIE